MKKLLLLLTVLLALAAPAQAAYVPPTSTPNQTVQVYPSGAVSYPTNFVSANHLMTTTGASPVSAGTNITVTGTWPNITISCGSMPFSSLTSLPTTIAGYGITDAVSLTGTQTLTNKTLTAPTLTAPVLGTPASGNLVNCTFPQLNQNTTGSAGSVGTGTYLPYLTSGVPSAATSAQVQAVIGSSVYAPSSTNLTAIASGLTPTYQGGFVTQNIVGMGDSTTQGSQTIPSSFSDQTWENYGWSMYLAATPFAQSSSVYELGWPGRNISSIASDYAASSFSTTVTTTQGSISATITGSTSGISNNQVVASANTSVGTSVAGISGTALTLSNIATASGSVTMYFTSPYQTSFYRFCTPQNRFPTAFGGVAHMISPAVTGIPGYIVDWAGLNDIYVNCFSQSVTTSSGNLTISGLTGVSGTTGYNVFGANIPAGATVASATSTSITLATGYAPTSSATETITICPQQSSYRSSYASLVTAQLADSWNQVFVCTLLPVWTTAPSPGTQAPYQANINLFNSWLKATYGGSAYGGSSVSGVTLIDLSSLPQFQSYSSTYYYIDGIHFTVAGQQAIAQAIQSALIASAPSTLASTAANPAMTDKTNMFSENAVFKKVTTLLGAIFQQPHITTGTGTITHTGGAITVTGTNCNNNAQLVLGSVIQATSTGHYYRMAQVQNANNSWMAFPYSEAFTGSAYQILPPAFYYKGTDTSYTGSGNQVALTTDGVYEVLTAGVSPVLEWNNYASGLSTTSSCTLWQDSSYNNYFQINGNRVLQWSTAGISTSGKIISGGPVRLTGYTVATLPSGTQGDTAFVTDAVSPTYNGTLTGGGSVVTRVFYNGTAWVSQ